MKTYTNRSNCARAAKVKFGKDAKPGKDFTISGSGKEWTFAAIEKAKTAGTRKPRPLHLQPNNQRIVKLMARDGGATIVQMATALDCEQHTVRGAISRMRAEVTITKGKSFKHTTFHCTLPKDMQG